MLRKKFGQVLCLAPSPSEGSADGMGQALAEALGLPSEAEAQAAATVGQEEPAAEEVEPEAEGKVEEPAATAQAEDLEAAKAEASELRGKVALLTEMNKSLNAEKAELQVALDGNAAKLAELQSANDAMRPAAIRQIQALGIYLHEPVASDLAEKSPAELGSMCSTLLAKLAKLPTEQKSLQVPSGSDGEPAPAVVPSASESGLSGY